MKKIDIKKLIILILIILVVAGLTFFIIKKVNKSSKPATEEETKIAEEASIHYISRLTYGSGTSYKGMDLLFAQDKYTYDDLTVGNILTVAYEYAIDNLNTTVPNSTIDEISNSFNVDEFTIMPGEVIRTAIKELFGVDFENQDYLDTINYNYLYRYLPEYDVYLRGYIDLKIDTSNYFIDYKPIKTTSKKDKLQTEIAVAYKYYDGTKYYFTKDSSNDDIIYESESPELKDDELDKFEHYTITLKKVNDKYVFDSIEKNK